MTTRAAETLEETIARYRHAVLAQAQLPSVPIALTTTDLVRLLDAAEAAAQRAGDEEETARLLEIESAARRFGPMHFRDHDGCQDGDPCKIARDDLRAALLARPRKRGKP